MASDHFHAFLPYPPVPVPHAGDGPLRGLRLAVKDLFDVAGYRTGWGNPTRLAASEPAGRHAPVVAALLEAGAAFAGKTHTDELAWSIFGINPHFGTPRNPAAPDRIPGGSSSGSAVAVAGGLADIAIGTDTGGSVRVPAAFCGLWGLRPSHGRISLEGCMKLAPSFDTAGLFARDAETLRRAGAAILGDDPARGSAAPRLMIAADMMARAAPAPRAALHSALEAIGRRHRFGEPAEICAAAAPDALGAAFRTIQAEEALAALGPWLDATGAALSPPVAERFAFARAVTAAEADAARRLRQDFAVSVVELLGDDGFLLAPAIHDVAPRLDASAADLAAYRSAAMELLAFAGLAGLPQIVWPIGRVDSAPYGLSLIGPRGSDRRLIDLADALAGA